MTFRLHHLPRWLRDIVPLVLWLGLIFFLSHQPTLLDVEEELGSLGQKLLYKSAHVLAYAVLAWLWWRALSPGRQLTPAHLWAAFILTTLYGVSDEIQIAQDPSLDANGNGVLDECEEKKSPPGDLDGDSFVTGADLGLLLALWGTGSANGDLDGDGIVGGADLGVLLANWSP